MWTADPRRRIHSTQLAHALAITETTLALGGACRTEVRLAGTRLIPDAVVGWEGRTWLVEVDRGTEAGDRFAQKLHDLARWSDRVEHASVLAVLDTKPTRRIEVVRSYLRAYAWVMDDPTRVGQVCWMPDLVDLGPRAYLATGWFDDDHRPLV